MSVTTRYEMPEWAKAKEWSPEAKEAHRASIRQMLEQLRLKVRR